MRFEPLGPSSAFLIRPDRHEDARGWFARSFCVEEFRAVGLPVVFPQHNISYTRHAGSLRGMHFQLPPYEEPKVIRCTRGAIFDVLADLRPDSPTYRLWFGAELTPENGDALYAPPGFAHGFQTLADDTEVSYLMGTPYVPCATSGIRYDDPALGIRWPREVTIVSEADKALPFLAGR